jgi:hypothetical protein
MRQTDFVRQQLHASGPHFNVVDFHLLHDPQGWRTSSLTEININPVLGWPRKFTELDNTHSEKPYLLKPIVRND